MSEGARKWLKDTPELAAGQWRGWDYGKDRRGWSLDCGGMFHADVGPGQRVMW
jgi:hypothetical protein